MKQGDGLMIRGGSGELTVEYNECGTEEYGGTLEFQAFVQEIKSQGWRVCKNEDEWEHVCPDCQH